MKIIYNDNEYEFSFPGLKEAIKQSSIDEALKKKIISSINYRIFKFLFFALTGLLLFIFIFFVMFNIQDNLRILLLILLFSAQVIIQSKIIFDLHKNKFQKSDIWIISFVNKINIIYNLDIKIC